MSYKKYNDYELLYMVRENDDDSRNLLMEKYIPIMKSLAEEFYNRYGDFGCDFDDFYLEAQMGFHKAVMNFTEDKNVLFYTFAVVCIKNALQTFCRNLTCKKNNISNYDKVDISSYQIADVKADVSSLITFSEMESIIKNVIFNFSIDYSSILELKYNGFSFKEISILLDCPITSVQFKYHRLKSRLKYKLLGYYYK